MLAFLQRIGWFIGLVLIQVLVLNHVHIGGYATPFLYIYFILTLNSGTDRNLLLLWAFALGLVIDIFCNTPGMHAAAITFVAFLRDPIIKLVSLKEMEGEFEPRVSTMGTFPYFEYAFLCTLSFCTIIETIDTFSFFQWKELMMKISADTAITIVCIFCIEAIRRKKREKGF